MAGGQLICRSCPKPHRAAQPHTDATPGPRTWLVRVYAGYETRPDGTRRKRYLNRTVEGTKKEAQAALVEWLQGKNVGTLADPGRTTLNSWLDTWLSDVASKTVRPRTLDSYTWLLKRYVRPVLGGYKLRDLSTPHLDRLYADMSKRGLSGRTVRYAHAVLSGALRDAVRKGVLARNPAQAATLPRQRRFQPRVLTADEARHFLTLASNDRNYGVLLAFALASGMRPSEYLALRWSDLDLESGAARVVRTVRKVKGGFAFDEPKTESSRRVVLLPASLAALLKRHRETSPYNRPEDLVFAGTSGQPLDEHGVVRRRFKALLAAMFTERLGDKAQARAEASRIRLYDARHSCATLLLPHEPVKVVSERLGHASAAFTMTVYQHVLPGMQEKAARTLDGLLTGRSTSDTLREATSPKSLPASS